MPADERAQDHGHAWPDALSWRVAEREERFRRAHEVAAEAVTVPASERSAWMQSHPDCLCPEFVELMIAMARERRGEEPRESVRCAHLAVTAIEEYVRLGGGDGDDVRALAWAELGNAHRICGDLRNAGMAFHHARITVRDASDPLARIEVYSLEASYSDCRGELQAAERSLLRAERLARRFGTQNLLAKLQIQRAEVIRSLGRVVEAIDLVRSALERLETRAEPNLALGGLHNLAHYLILAGCPYEGRELFRRLRPVYLVFADDRLNGRRSWLEAKASRELGELEPAATMYEEVRQYFANLGSGYDVAIIGLDLIEIYSTTGRWTEVESLAHETLELCRGIGVTTEIVATAMLLVEMAARRQAGLAEARSLVANLRHALTPRAWGAPI